MPRPRLVSDDEILKTARGCFMEHGVGISTQCIADKVGISQAAIFKRFGTKEELMLRALAPPERLAVIDWVEAAPVPGPFRPQLEELLSKIWETLSAIMPRLVLIHASPLTPEAFLARYKTPPLVNLVMSVAGFLKRAQQNGQIRADGDALAWAMNVVGTLQGRAVVRFLMRANIDSGDDSDYLTSTAELLYRGFSLEEDKK